MPMTLAAAILAAQNIDTITVVVNRENVPPGTYNPVVSIASDGGNAEITLTVAVQ